MRLRGTFFREGVANLIFSCFSGFCGKFAEKMSDNLMDKVNALGERLKIGGSEVGQKITAGMSSMSFKMKEFFQGPNQTDKIVEEATAETLDEPDWATNLELCDMVNHDRINSVELIRGIKKRIILKSPRIQYLALVLLETVVKNCEKAFSEVAAERILDEMVKLIDDPQTVVNNRNKALMLIESWGESSDELRYLPVYEETYKVLLQFVWPNFFCSSLTSSVYNQRMSEEIIFLLLSFRLKIDV